MKEMNLAREGVQSRHEPRKMVSKAPYSQIQRLGDHFSGIMAARHPSFVVLGNSEPDIKCWIFIGFLCCRLNCLKSGVNIIPSNTVSNVD